MIPIYLKLCVSSKLGLPIRKSLCFAELQVGVVDATNTSKLPTLMIQYFRNGVYQVQWGPLTRDSDLGLYACSEGKVVVYNPSKSLEGKFKGSRSRFM